MGSPGIPPPKFSIDVTTLASWSVATTRSRQWATPRPRRAKSPGQGGNTTVTATLSGKTGAGDSERGHYPASFYCRVTTHRQRSGGPDLTRSKPTAHSDNTTTRNITTDVTWTSSDATIATISKRGREQWRCDRRGRFKHGRHHHGDPAGKARNCTPDREPASLWCRSRSPRRRHRPSTWATRSRTP